MFFKALEAHNLVDSFDVAANFPTGAGVLSIVALLIRFNQTFLFYLCIIWTGFLFHTWVSYHWLYE